MASDAFGHWLAGFIDGEGCFTISRQPGRRNSWYCRFHIRLRGDDAAILREIRDYLGVGNLYAYDPTPRALEHLSGTKPSAQLVITAHRDCVRLVEVLDRFPLRAKKARDYAIWREAVRHRPRNDWSAMQGCAERLRAVREYDADPMDTVPSPQLELLEVA